MTKKGGQASDTTNAKFASQSLITQPVYLVLQLPKVPKVLLIYLFSLPSCLKFLGDSTAKYIYTKIFQNFFHLLLYIILYSPIFYHVSASDNNSFFFSFFLHFCPTHNRLTFGGCVVRSEKRLNSTPNSPPTTIIPNTTEPLPHRPTIYHLPSSILLLLLLLSLT